MPNERAFYIYTSQVFTEDAVLQDHYVRITDGLISEITSTPQGEIKVYDYSGFSLIPGLIDLHIHGREGCDVMDGKMESIHTISNSLSQYGVTGFLATTVTSTWDKTLQAFEVIGKATVEKMPGAEVLGAYNEGLFFTETHKGAHNEAFFLELSKARIDAIFNASNQSLKVMAMAPEFADSMEQITYLNSLGVKVMLGHTNASYECANQALQAGAAGGVHIFNGMSGIHHRDPGCAGAVLMDTTAVAEVIADGVHLHPNILQLIYRLKGPEKIALISDCICAGGFPDGTYQLGELSVEVKAGVARTKQGSLAGSTLTLNNGIRNMHELGQVPMHESVNMASIVPAKHIGVDSTLGSITVGKRANLAIVNASLAVKCTMIDGVFVYQR